jgi:pSer/pThr/pTyr-binding forkhead associated (FHA) protein
MEKLILLSEDSVSQEFPLTEQIASIGREKSNTIHLSDKSVSRLHATVQRVFRGFIIQDEGSTNGTRVNGRPVTKQFLKHNDLIEIGSYQLRFFEGSAEQRFDDADETVVIRQPMPEPALETPRQKPGPAQAPASAATPPASAETAAQPSVKKLPESDQAAPPPTEVQPARICYMAGELKGREVEVDRAFFSVGNPAGDLVLIRKRNTGYYLVKVGGEIPPTLNGNPVKAGGVQLHNGDRIELGKLSLEFRLQAQEPCLD